MFKSYASSLSHLEKFFLFLDLFHAAVTELLKEKMHYRKLMRYNSLAFNIYHTNGTHQIHNTCKKKLTITGNFVAVFTTRRLIDFSL